MGKTFSFESGKEAESPGREETFAPGCRTYMALLKSALASQVDVSEKDP